MVRIDSCSFGEVKVDGKIYYSDVIVWWDGKVEQKTSSHEFKVNDLMGLLEKNPDSVVVGTGQSGCVVISDKAKELAEQKKIKIFSDLSPKAFEIFNGFIKDNKKVVAVIHATC